MVYKVEDIVRRVRTEIDRNMQSAQLAEFGDLETLSLDALIREKIPQAARLVVLRAPLHLLGWGIPFGEAVEWLTDYSGHTILPDDFLRLLSFKMDDWSQPITEIIESGTPEYERQQCPFAGIRGNASHPTCAIVHTPTGLMLEWYGSNSNNAHIATAQYLPVPRIDALGRIVIPEKVYAAVVLLTASLVAAVYQSDLADSLEARANQILGLDKQE